MHASLILTFKFTVHRISRTRNFEIPCVFQLRTYPSKIFRNTAMFHLIIVTPYAGNLVQWLRAKGYCTFSLAVSQMWQLRLLQHPCHIMYSLDPYIKLLVHDVDEIVPFSMFSDMNYFPFSCKTSWICRDVQLQERGGWNCHEWTAFIVDHSWNHWMDSRIPPSVPKVWHLMSVILLRVQVHDNALIVSNKSIFQ